MPSTVQEPTSVVRSDELLVDIPAGDLKNALLMTAQAQKLKLVYNVSSNFHVLASTQTGSALEIAQHLVSDKPIRVYRTQQALVCDQIWVIGTKGSLKKQIQRWSQKAHWTVVWSTRMNQHMESSAAFYGSFDEAVENLFQSLRATGSRIEPSFYPNHTVVIK